MESQKVVVVVEEADAARAALQWAVRNFIRGGDSITLLYVFPSTRSKRKQRNYRLKGFQLALSFKELCNGIAEAKVEIIVTDGDKGALVVSTVMNTRASTLVVGLHDKSFLYKVLQTVKDNDAWELVDSVVYNFQGSYFKNRHEKPKLSDSCY